MNLESLIVSLRSVRNALDKVETSGYTNLDYLLGAMMLLDTKIAELEVQARADNQCADKSAT